MHIVTSSSVNKLSNMLQLDILKVNFEIFPKHFSWGSSIVGRLMSFFNWFFAKRLKTVRTMNLKFVWSELPLISVRSQNLLAFATAVEAFVNTAPCIVQCQQPFHVFSIRCQSIEKLHRKYRSCKAKRTALQVRHGLPF